MSLDTSLVPDIFSKLIYDHHLMFVLINLEGEILFYNRKFRDIILGDRKNFDNIESIVPDRLKNNYRINYSSIFDPSCGCFILDHKGKEVFTNVDFKVIDINNDYYLGIFFNTEEDIAFQQKEIFKIIFNQSSLGKALATKYDKKFIKTNKRFCEMLGYTEQELYNFTFLDITHEDYIIQNMYLAAQMDSGKIDHYQIKEKKFIRKDGSELWARVWVDRIEDTAGEMIYYLGTIEDISDLKQLEEELKERDNINKIMFNNSPLGKCFISHDFNFIEFNKSFCDILGYSKEEISSMNYRNILLKEDLPTCEILRKELVDEEIGVYIYEQRCINKKRDIIWLKIWIKKTDIELKNISYMITIDDITEQKELEKTLIEKDKLATIIFEQSPLGKSIINIDGRFVKVNNKFCEILGYSETEILTKTFKEITYHEDFKKSIDLMDRVNKKEIEEYNFIKRYIRKDGGVIWVKVWIKRILTEFEDIDYYIETIEDITENKILEIELENKQKRLIEQIKKTNDANVAKSLFISTVSHEIRNPLNNILGIIELLKNTPLSDTQNRYINNIEKSGDLLCSILNNVLDISKIESGLLSLKEKEFELTSLFEDIQNMYVNLIGKNIKFSYYIDERLLNKKFIGDSFKIKQVFSNLIGNAMKFTSSGKIFFGCYYSNKVTNDIYFFVRDTGIGISEENMKTIFNQFSSIDSNSEKNKSIGLGLSICRKLIQLMGGCIWVDSVRNKGSNFSFFIPLKLQTEETLNQNKTEYNKITASLNILLIEDNIINCEVLKSFINQLGYDCDISFSGKDALRNIRNKKYDIILIDINLSDLNGFEIVKNINILYQERKPHTIFTTGQLLTEDLLKQADDFILKPVTSKVIKEKINIYLNKLFFEKLIDLDKVEELSEITDEDNSTLYNKIANIFMMEYKNKIYEIFELLKTKDNKEIFKKVHYLKGSCCQVGAIVLSDIADSICRHLEKRDIDQKYLERQVNNLDLFGWRTIEKLKMILAGDS